MGEILSVKKQKNNQFLAEIRLDEREYLNLQGHTNDVMIFSDRVSFVDARMSQRGKNGATKYFLIPRQLRKDVNFNSSISCQKIDCGKKILFVYVVDTL